MHDILHACCMLSPLSPTVGKGSSGDTAGWRMWCSVSHVPAGAAVFLSPPLRRNQLCSTCFAFHPRFSRALHSRDGSGQTAQAQCTRTAKVIQSFIIVESLRHLVDIGMHELHRPHYKHLRRRPSLKKIYKCTLAWKFMQYILYMYEIVSVIHL